MSRAFEQSVEIGKLVNIYFLFNPFQFNRSDGKFDLTIGCATFYLNQYKNKRSITKYCIAFSEILLYNHNYNLFYN